MRNWCLLACTRKVFENLYKMLRMEMGDRKIHLAGIMIAKRFFKYSKVKMRELGPTREFRLKNWIRKATTFHSNAIKPNTEQRAKQFLGDFLQKCG